MHLVSPDLSRKSLTLFFHCNIASQRLAGKIGGLPPPPGIDTKGILQREWEGHLLSLIADKLADFIIACQGSGR